MPTTTDIMTAKEVKASSWVRVEIIGREVTFTPKRGHHEVLLTFDNPGLFDPPCAVLHITQPEIVSLRAKPGESMYSVYEPDKIRRRVVSLTRKAANATSYLAEKSNPSGPIIVT
jgi:hypothetical protein